MDVTGVLYMGHFIAGANYVLQGGFFIIFARIDNNDTLVSWT